MKISVARRALALALCIPPFAFGCSRSPREPSGVAEAPAAGVAPASAGKSDKASSHREELPPLDRRIIRQAALEIEASSSRDAQVRATRVAEQAGGFVAGSEEHEAAAEGERTARAVTMTLRVPAERFSFVLAELRRLGQGASTERVTSDDVTEEFVDLEARIHNQERLEAQFLEILKTATKVEDALQVQRELSVVRTEIERMQGRRRFLERATALSTITLTIVTLEPLISATTADFKHAVVRAYSDAVDLGAGIVTGAIRLAGVMLPLLMLVGLPLVLGLRLLISRSRRALPTTPSE